ncbi:MAG: 2-octaprenyl-6-methoxyphenyl hydroxylase [Hahellaceae bacterium]|nr:2-octaprenyl-6-methoxyphenyl hydroxylase [Hahellaceae bacterium]
MSESSAKAGKVEKADIVIVGGGLVGATLALALTRLYPVAYPRRIVLIEAAAFSPQAPGTAQHSPSFDTRATALSESTVDVFKQLGVWPLIESVAAPISLIHVSEQGRWGATRLNAEEQGREAFGHVALNSGIGQALLQQLANEPGVALRAPWRVKRLQPVPQGMDVYGDGDAEPLRAGLVVLADGGRSPLLPSLGIQASVHPYEQVAIIANLEPYEAANGRAFERFTDDGAMAILPLCEHQGRPRVALVWTRPAEDAGRVLQLSDAEFIRELEVQFGERLGGFRWLGERVAYPLSRQIVREQSRHGLVVLGNAAHTLHPIAGQGFNLCMRDAMALATHLQQRKEGESPGDAGLLRAYVSGQQTDQLWTAMAGDVLLSVFASSSRLVSRVRQAGLISLALLPGLRHRVADFGMGKSPLNATRQPSQV